MGINDTHVLLYTSRVTGNIHLAEISGDQHDQAPLSWVVARTARLDGDAVGGRPLKPSSTVGRDRTKTEQYQKQFARVALDTGADLVFGHGTHTIQGVEIYKGKPILYAIGHSNFDQPGYEKSVDGLVVRVVIRGKSIVRVSFVPVTRDSNNDVYLLDPSQGEGAKLVQAVKDRSTNLPALRLEGQEMVLMDKATASSDNK